MTQVVFVGPSLPASEVRALHPEVVIHPPVRQGDIVSVLRAHRPSAIGIIDGVFLNVLSVWHKELLLALDEGVSVFGAASMGALRAAECAPFGMVGLGRIYDRFADGTLTRDDEVAVAHATAEFGHRSLSEPLVNLRFNLEAAARAGVIDTDLATALIDEAAAVYFPDRSWPRVLASPLLSGECRAALEAHLRKHAIDHKAADARLLLRTMAGLVTDKGTPPPPSPAPAVAPWSLEHTHYLQALVERDRWTTRQGEAISQEAIARHTLVNDPRAEELARQALVDLLALVAARHLGLEAEGPTSSSVGPPSWPSGAWPRRRTWLVFGPKTTSPMPKATNSWPTGPLSTRPWSGCGSPGSSWGWCGPCWTPTGTWGSTRLGPMPPPLRSSTTDVERMACPRRWPCPGGARRTRSPATHGRADGGCPRICWPGASGTAFNIQTLC